MPNKEEAKDHKRMVVEEVEAKPQIVDPAAKVSSKELISEEVKPESEIKSDQEQKPLTEPSQKSQFATVPHDTKKLSPIFWIIIPGIFLLGAILGGIVFYQKGVNQGQEEANPTPTASSSVTPSASPSATLDLTKYTISIFNGSGIAGEAGRAKTLLTTAGFKVGSTGNAATYDYTKTIIKAKTTVDAAYVAELSTALGKTYLVDTAQTLASSSADTVQVVIGSSKAQ